MPRRSRAERVTERMQQRLDDEAQRRREAAQRGAETRRRRRGEQEQQAQHAMGRAAEDLAATLRGERGRGRRRAAAEQPAQPAVRSRLRNLGRERKHADLLTIAIRGRFAVIIRRVAERYRLSLSDWLKDALLVYGERIANGYTPGAMLPAPDAWLEELAAGREGE